MVRAIEAQAASTAATVLAFDERLSLLVLSEVGWSYDRTQRPAGDARRPGGLQMKLNYKSAAG